MSAITHHTMTNLMGFQINGTSIPDPTAFTGKESDLDTLGERDATGYLHRNRVATKHPLSIEYKNTPWTIIAQICGLLMNASFQFTYPNPFSSGGTSTITAYAGDREFAAVWSPQGREWIGELKVSIIEY